MKKYVFIALLLLTVMPIDAQRRQKSEDAEQLGRAMEYFSSGKYHEALLLFQKLDDEYELNPRFKAYLGVCYYYEWNYEKATAYLDSVITKLDVYAPHERSFYYFADAESHFNLGHYRKCIPFQSALSYYQRYRNTPELKARITQIRKMLPGIEEEVKKRASDN